MTARRQKEKARKKAAADAERKAQKARCRKPDETKIDGSHDGLPLA